MLCSLHSTRLKVAPASYFVFIRVVAVRGDLDNVGRLVSLLWLNIQACEGLWLEVTKVCHWILWLPTANGLGLTCLLHVKLFLWHRLLLGQLTVFTVGSFELLRVYHLLLLGLISNFEFFVYFEVPRWGWRHRLISWFIDSQRFILVTLCLHHHTYYVTLIKFLKLS